MKMFFKFSIILISVSLLACSPKHEIEPGLKKDSDRNFIEFAIFDNLGEDIDPAFSEIGWYIDTGNKEQSQVTSYDLGWDVEFCEPEGFLICVDAPFDMAIPLNGNKFEYANSHGHQIRGKVIAQGESEPLICNLSGFELSIENLENKESSRFTFDRFLGLTKIRVDNYIGEDKYTRFHQSLKSGHIFKLNDYCRKE